MTDLPPYDWSHAHTAYHEAGHAVMACRLGLDFVDVTIIREGDTNGQLYGIAAAGTCPR